ncbi:MAG: ABC transporter ATP-binding protein, partial [Myxococcota bacterium]|nr:ABC transporter ATP-binding protein [Myxococcota bacterium]
QQQRVALARALAADPAVVLLDEPFANVDAALRAQLGADLRRLITAARVPALLVTHDREDALGLADRIAVLESGAHGAYVAQAASPAELYAAPSTAGVARMSGPCVLVPAHATGLEASSELGTASLRAPHNGAVELVVRPHQIRFSPGSGAARITQRRFTGPGWRLQVEGPSGPVPVAWPDPSPPPVDTTGSLVLQGPLAAIPGR